MWGWSISKMKSKRDFLTLDDLSIAEINQIISRGIELKKSLVPDLKPLSQKTLGLLFEKESTRTRVSFEVAMIKLGGHVIYLGGGTSQLSRGESYADTAKVLSRYLDAIVFRGYSQKDLEDMATHADIPVINGLTDLYHPCQILADLMTIQEKMGDYQLLKIAYIGDGNNMANSWLKAALKLEFQLNMACPKGFEPAKSILKECQGKSHISYGSSPIQALQEVDVINTDTWFSMGQKVTAKKRGAFKGFQVNKNLLKQGSNNAIVLHCLPAHRGEEITDEVLDGKQSVVFDQAQNRLYAQMALLEFLL